MILGYFQEANQEKRKHRHFLFFNFKSREKRKLFFGFVRGLWAEIFFILVIASTWSQIKKIRKWPYLSPEATNLKSKGIYFFLLRPLGSDMVIFSFSGLGS